MVNLFGKEKTEAAAEAEKKPAAKGTKKNPAIEVRERFGSKDELVKEVRKLFEKTDFFSDKVNADKGIERVSNKKLLRLHRMATRVQEKFGTRKKLIEAYVQLTNKGKLANVEKKLSNLTLGRLLDLYGRAEKQSRKTAGKTA
ncbi:MAG: hypothetical protein ABIJ56_06140 [Pseudomonadota bacterium]